MSWVPIAAAVLTSVVNVLLAFGMYMGRRETDTSALTKELTVTDTRTQMDRRHTDEHLLRIDDELRSIKSRLYELSTVQLTALMVRVGSIEAESKTRAEDARQAHARLEDRLDDIYRVIKPV